MALLWVRADDMSDTLWWVEQETRIKKLEAKHKLLKAEYDRLSDMVDFLVKKVHHLESTNETG